VLSERKVDGLDLDAGPDGTVAVAWPDGGHVDPIYPAVRDPGRRFGAAQAVGGPYASGGAKVAVRPGGGAIVAWEHEAGQPSLMASCKR
jgi:hypothetical protein